MEFLQSTVEKWFVLSMDILSKFYCNDAIRNLTPSLIRKVHTHKTPRSLDVSLGEPNIPMDAELLQKGEQRYRQTPPGYTPNLGLPELRQAIAKYYEKRCCKIDPHLSEKNVMVTVGSQEALFLAFFALLNPGDEVILTDPCYAAYAPLAQMCRAQVVYLALKEEDDYQLNLDELEKKISHKTKFLLINSPNNPTGKILPRTILQGIARLAKKHHFYVISDEIYHELYLHTQPDSIASEMENVIVIGGLSKSCAMTGYRLGYLIAPADWIRAFHPIHQILVTSAPTLAQCIALEAFLEPRFLSLHRTIYSSRFLQAKQALQKYDLPFIEPDGAFYVCVPIVPEKTCSLNFCLELAEKKEVLAAPGSAFGITSQAWIRLSFASDPGVFEEACKRLKLFV